ncbi:unnamed protein product [Phytophthora lilii]|uniref:Unnamed protein product n=1 Tax=Phytophthora lilii TaxID=2077276 RepID=A0A9W6UB21_9STRA|nr:unnamed protein product [Phytophthora lilii]
MIAIGFCTYWFSDDCPRGNYVDLRRNHVMADRAKSELFYGFIAVARQPVAWILAFQYACCVGVELQVHNVLNLYYYEDFKIAGCDVDTDANECRLLTRQRPAPSRLASGSCASLLELSVVVKLDETLTTCNEITLNNLHSIFFLLITVPVSVALSYDTWSIECCGLMQRPSTNELCDRGAVSRCV